MADCAFCGGPVPPRKKPGGYQKVYCSPKCGSAARMSASRLASRGCPECPHCVAERSRPPPEWVTEAIEDVRGWVRVARELAAFREAVQQGAA